MSTKSRCRTTEVLNLLENAQSLLEHQKENGPQHRLSMQAEIRTLEFWRAVIAECIATFFYVLMLASVHQALNHPKDSIATVQLYSALTAGLAMCTLTHAFLQVSGAHMSPALSISCVLLRRISFLRGALYTCSQCGGAVAGAALVYGVYGAKFGAKEPFGPTTVSNFGMEFILTFLVVYVYFGATDPARRPAAGGAISDPAIVVGLAHMAALAAYRGALNPARALGPCFVADSWDFHWVFWVGPILGAACGGFCYTFIFNLNRPRWTSGVVDGRRDGDNCSLKSDDDMLDDLERVRQLKTANMIRATFNEASSVYNSSVRPFKRPLGCSDSVYGGTKSLYNAPTTTSAYDNDRPAAVVDCSRSVYGGGGTVDEREFYRHIPRDSHSSRVSLKRSQSVHSRAGPRRNPQDVLPDEPPLVRPTVAPSCRSSRHKQPQQQLHSHQLAQTAAAAGEKISADVDGEFGDGAGASMYSNGSDAAYREYIRQKNAAADQCSGSSSGYYSSSREQEQHQQQQQLHQRQQSLGSQCQRGEVGGSSASSSCRGVGAGAGREEYTRCRGEEAGGEFGQTEYRPPGGDYGQPEYRAAGGYTAAANSRRSGSTSSTKGFTPIAAGGFHPSNGY